MNRIGLSKQSSLVRNGVPFLNRGNSLSLFSVRTLSFMKRSPYVQLDTRIVNGNINITRQLHSLRLLFNSHHNPKGFKARKDKLLEQATGPISRLLVHIKWTLKRNNRPFSIDDISAFASWLVMGNVLWILLGTTTFGLVLLYSLHAFDRVRDNIIAYFNNESNPDDDESNPSDRKPSSPASGYKIDDSIVGYVTSAILSHGLGIKIVFEKGKVLPEFKDGKLIFNNLRLLSLDDDVATNGNINLDCQVKSMNLTLSFNKWSEGHGLIYDLEIFGLQGKLLKSNSSQPSTPSIKPQAESFSRFHDSIHFQYDMNDNQEVNENQSPITSRIDPNYELSLVKIHDSYVEVFHDNIESPLKISIFNCELPKVRGKALLIDFFNANNVTGAINDSMFTIHKKPVFKDNISDDKTIRFQIDGIDIGMLSRLNPKLKFNWVLNGKAEIITDIRLPKSDVDANSVFKLEYKKISETINAIMNDMAKITVDSHGHDNNDNDLNNKDETKLMKTALQAIYETFNMNGNDDLNMDSLQEYAIINAKVKFHNLKAKLPKELPMASSGNVPFVTLHDLRSLIAYVNKLDTDNTPPLTIKAMTIEKVSNLYNIENLAQLRAFDVLVSEIYEELLKIVKSDEQRIISQKSSLWSHSIASQLLLLGLGVFV